MTTQRKTVLHWYRLALEQYQSGKVEEGRRAHAQVKRLDPGGYYDLVLQADEYFASRRFEEALIAFDRALGHQQVAVDDAFIYIFKSLTLLCLDRPQEATQAIDEGIARMPTSVYLHEYRAELLLKIGRLPDLPEAYDAILRLRPQAVNVHIFKSLALFLLGRLEEAQAVQVSLLAILPNPVKPPPFQGQQREQLEHYAALIGEAVARDRLSAAAWCYRAEVLRLLHATEQQLEDASAALDEALRLDPQAVLAHNGRGNILFAQQRYREAATSYARAVELRPDVQGFRENRNRAVRAAEGSAPGKKKKKGRGDHRRAGRSAPTRSGLLSLPSTEEFAQLLEEGRFEEALAVTEQEIARAGNISRRESALLLKATILGHLAGRTDEALAIYREILRQSPASQQVWQEVIDLLSAAGRREEALEACEQALCLHGSNSDLHTRKGAILVQLGRTEEALESFERALALAPENAVNWLNVAMGRAAQGRFAEALPIFDGTIGRARGQQAPVAMLGKANALLALGRTEVALQLLADAVAIERERRQNPADDEREAIYDQVGGDLLARLYFMQGEAFFAKKDFANALASYDLALSIEPNPETETRREHALAELHLAAGEARDAVHGTDLRPTRFLERVPRWKVIGLCATLVLLLVSASVVIFQIDVDPVLRPAVRLLHLPLELLAIVLYAGSCWWGWHAGTTTGHPAVSAPAASRAPRFPRLYGAVRYGWNYLFVLLPFVVVVQFYDYLSPSDPLAGAIGLACFPLLLLHTVAVSILFLTRRAWRHASTGDRSAVQGTGTASGDQEGTGSGEAWEEAEQQREEVFSVIMPLIEAGRYQEALGALDEAARQPLVPAAVFVLKAVLLSSLNRLDEALESLDIVLGKHPSSKLRPVGLSAEGFYDAHLRRAFVLERLNRHEEALLEYEEALVLDAKDPMLYSSMGRLLAHLKRHAEALSAFDQAIVRAREQSSPSTEVAYHLMNKANVLTSLGRYSEAIDLFRESVRTHPRDAHLLQAIQVNLAGALALAGRYDEALAPYLEVVSLDPRDAIKQDPAFLVAFLGLAEVQVRLGRREEANAVYERLAPVVSSAELAAMRKQSVWPARLYIAAEFLGGDRPRRGR
jgi:tetratricopeptide (TPR) repeat protein